jgi:hypothetical protein
MGTSDIEEYLYAIELTDEERRTCTAIVDKLFSVYSEFTEEAYAFVTQHALEDLQSGTGFGERLSEARLPEAQILRGAQL